MTDKLITVTTMLFILSMISERVVTFIKLHCGKDKRFLFFIVPAEVDTCKKSKNAEDETKRSRSILAINLTVGITIALCANANLFEMFSYTPDGNFDVLGWDFKGDFDFQKIPSVLIGCILTGFFISMGSKFWHDLLDLLLESKNLKGKLAEKATYEMNTVKELDEWISISNADMVKKVFEENKAGIKALNNVVSVGIGNDNGVKCIEVAISDDDRRLIPESLPYYLPNNSVRKIPVKVIQSSVIRTQAAITFGSDITNSTRPNFFGSFGLAVKFKGSTDGSQMLLSCYHVVKGTGHDFNAFRFMQQETVIAPHGSGQAIGSIRNAVRNAQVDAAIVDINSGVQLSNQLPSGGVIKEARTIAYEEEDKDIAVRMFGYKTQPMSSGTIKSLYNHAKIMYALPGGGTEQWDMYGLMGISNNGKAISQPGDSGSALIDSNNKVVGMIVAGSDVMTYAIPIQTVFNNLNIELV